MEYRGKLGRTRRPTVLKWIPRIWHQRTSLGRVWDSVAAMRKRSPYRRCISCIASGIDNRRCLLMRYRRYLTICFYSYRPPEARVCLRSVMSSQGAQGAEYSGSVLSKAKNTSWVWKHYVLDRKPSEKEKFPPARCKLCDKVVTRARGNTSNMNRHIWDKHSVECSL